MALQIHGVVKEAQDFDHLAVRSAPDAEKDEMTPFAALAGDVKRGNALQDVISLSCADDCRTGGQIIQRRRNRSGVDARLCFAELVHRPAQDFLEVGLGDRRQADRPSACSNTHFERVAGFPPIALSAMAVK